MPEGEEITPDKLPPPPIYERMWDMNGRMNMRWERWFSTLYKIIRGL